MEAFTYTRVSSDGQVSGTGLDRQQQAIDAYAARNGYTIVRTFSEEGISGTEGLTRVALSALFASLELYPAVRTVLVEGMDRIGRDLLVSEIILAEFEKRGVRVIEVTGGNDLSCLDGSPTRKLIRQILAAIAEFDKTVIVNRLAVARQAVKQRTGRCEGRKPYGFRDGEQNTLSLILQLGRTGMNSPDIATYLNQSGRRSRSGGLWRASVIRRIVERNSAGGSSDGTM